MGFYFNEKPMVLVLKNKLGLVLWVYNPHINRTRNPIEGSNSSQKNIGSSFKIKPNSNPLAHNPSLEPKVNY